MQSVAALLSTKILDESHSQLNLSHSVSSHTAMAVTAQNHAYCTRRLPFLFIQSQVNLWVMQLWISTHSKWVLAWKRSLLRRLGANGPAHQLLLQDFFVIFIHARVTLYEIQYSAESPPAKRESSLAVYSFEWGNSRRRPQVVSACKRAMNSFPSSPKQKTKTMSFSAKNDTRTKVLVTRLTMPIDLVKRTRRQQGWTIFIWSGHPRQIQQSSLSLQRGIC